jgi:hypothetical protein
MTPSRGAPRYRWCRCSGRAPPRSSIHSDGADAVREHHVETAAEVFGRKQLVAIDSQELAVLQRVRTKGTFVQTSEKDLALLATRRVLEYTNGHARFAVHPTIEPLLAQIPEVA